MTSAEPQKAIWWWSETQCFWKINVRNVLSNELLKVIIVSLMVNREYCPILSRIMFVPLLRYRPLWRKWLISLFYMQIMLRLNSERRSIQLLFFHQVVLMTLFIRFWLDFLPQNFIPTGNEHSKLAPFRFSGCRFNYQTLINISAKGAISEPSKTFIWFV